MKMECKTQERKSQMIRSLKIARIFSIKWSFLALLAILILALLLRIYHLDQESAWYDEVASLQFIHAPNLINFIQQERVADPPMVPLYFVLQYCWAHIIGSSLYSIRILSIIMGLCTILFTYLISTKLYGEYAGLFSALLLALSIHHIYYSQEIRVYELETFLGAIAIYSLIGIIQDYSKKKWWIINIIANSMLLWTHLFALFFLITEGIFLLVHSCLLRQKKSYVFWILAQLPIFLLWTIWFTSIDFTELGNMTRWISGLNHSPLLIIKTLIEFSGGCFYRLSEVRLGDYFSFGTIYGLFFFIIIARMVWLLLVSSRRNDKNSDCFSSVGNRSIFVFLLMWLLVPVIILYIYSLFIYSSYISRYVIPSSLSLFIFAGGFVATFRSRKYKTSIMIVLIMLYVCNLIMNPGPWRPDWKSIAHEAKKAFSHGETVVALYKGTLLCLLYATGASQEQIIVTDDCYEIRDVVCQALIKGRNSTVIGNTNPLVSGNKNNLEYIFHEEKIIFQRKDFANRQPSITLFHIAYSANSQSCGCGKGSEAAHEVGGGGESVAVP